MKCNFKDNLVPKYNLGTRKALVATGILAGPRRVLPRNTTPVDLPNPQTTSL
jgi:hypothetical protein